jgi:hypothetical protein
MIKRYPKCPENGSLLNPNPVTFSAKHRDPPKMLRAGLYARVSTNDQQTLVMRFGRWGSMPPGSDDAPQIKWT